MSKSSIVTKAVDLHTLLNGPVKIKTKKPKRGAPPAILFGASAPGEHLPEVLEMECKALLPQSALTYISELEPTGSRYICNPPVLDTDVDFIVHIKGTYATFETLLVKNGWVRDVSKKTKTKKANADYPEGEFRSYRNGKFNLIVTAECKYFESFVLATEIAKFLNLRDKAERVFLFEAIRTGVAPPAIDAYKP